MMMSGFCRITCFSELAKEWVSIPTSRWLTQARLSRCRNSIGSSMVMMWHDLLSLIRSIIAARLVDLPLPVGPVTRIRPRGSRHVFFITGGRPSSSMVLMVSGITRSTAPTEFF